MGIWRAKFLQHLEDVSQRDSAQRSIAQLGQKRLIVREHIRFEHESRERISDEQTAHEIWDTSENEDMTDKENARGRYQRPRRLLY